MINAPVATLAALIAKSKRSTERLELSAGIEVTGTVHQMSNGWKNVRQAGLPREMSRTGLPACRIGLAASFKPGIELSLFPLLSVRSTAHTEAHAAAYA